MEELNNQLQVLKIRIETMAKDYFGPEFCSEMVDYVVSHPFIAAALLVIAACSIIPVLIFLSFAFTSFVIIVIAFVCIEGSIIIFGGAILLGIVSLITVITVGFTSAAAIGYWFARNILTILHGGKRYGRQARNNLSAIRQNTANKSMDNGPQPMNGNIAADFSANQNGSNELINDEIQ